VTAANARSEEVLRGEILAGAKAKADETLARAKADADTLLVKARSDAEKEHREKLAAAKAQAATLTEQIMGRLPVDVGRMKSARIESLLVAVRDEVARRLAAREGFDYREAVITLAAEAVSRMDGSRFILSVSEADRGALCDGWLQDVRGRAGREVELVLAPEPAKIAGGVIVRDADGRQLCDESLAARLERLWPAARREIAVQSGLIQGGGAREEK
jgi:vacuolar-type H+-ATPase subunit E/Vma4